MNALTKEKQINEADQDDGEDSIDNQDPEHLRTKIPMGDFEHFLR